MLKSSWKMTKIKMKRRKLKIKIKSKKRKMKKNLPKKPKPKNLKKMRQKHLILTEMCWAHLMILKIKKLQMKKLIKRPPKKLKNNQKRKILLKHTLIKSKMYMINRQIRPMLRKSRQLMSLAVFWKEKVGLTNLKKKMTKKPP